MKRLGVIVTCFNRRETTKRCLYALFQGQDLADVELHVIVVDDGSTDGTADLLRSEFKNIEIITGDGSLYWNGGMHKGFTRALDLGFDGYLWLNDDTLLYPSAIRLLISTYAAQVIAGGVDAVIVGSTCDPTSKKLTYGGVVAVSKLKRLNFSMVSPTDEAVECDTMNGNCVLIPRRVVEKIGILDPVYQHAMGDTDYGLRAKSAGFKLLVAPGYVGECSRNPIGGSYNDKSLPLSLRLKKVLHPKGLPPRSWLAFTRKHAGPFWPVFFVWPYLKIIFS